MSPHSVEPSVSGARGSFSARELRRKWRHWSAAAAIGALLSAGPAVAQSPTGGTVVSGAAAISQAGSLTTINQSTAKTIINWQGFSVGAGATVTFNQPSNSAVALNRVIGNEASVISGALNANGRVFIVNSAGVLFTKSAQVNVGGLVASTLDISNEDFLAGNHVFAGKSDASVTNRGSIKASEGGYVALLGRTVINEGVIGATLGTVALAAGEKVTLNLGGDSLLDVAIDKGTLKALVANKQAIVADGGRVILTAKAADGLLSAQVNNSGIIQARTMAALKGGAPKTGKIELLAKGGTTTVSGKLDASAPDGGNGGLVETSGDKVKIADGAVVTTRAIAGTSGTWLIDPSDFTISAGSGALTDSGIGASTLAAALADGNVSLVTAASGNGAGDINVNAAVTWASDTTLTLTAAHDINVNKAVSATGGGAGLVLNAGHDIYINNAVTLSGANAALAMTYGGDYVIRTPASYAGAVIGPDGRPVAKQDTSGGVYGSITLSGSGAGLTINGQAYMLIHSMAELDALDVGTTPANTATGNFALAQSLDAAGTTYANAVILSLNGTLTGLGHTISNLTISAPATTPNVGLIGQALAGTTVRDIGLINANVSGRNLVGTLIGTGTATTISNAYATGMAASISTLSGTGINTGGLIGRLAGGSITGSFADVDVSGWGSVGGLAGSVTPQTAPGNVVLVGVAVSNSHALGDVSGKSSAVGGLIGSFDGNSIANSEAPITLSYAAGNVATSSVINVGGLVGQLGGGGLVSASFATGNVTGTGNQYGGLIGLSSGDLKNVYATGNVNGTSLVGGLVGSNMINNNKKTIGGHIENAFATGAVTAAASQAGGLVGNSGAGAVISNSFATGPVTSGAFGSAGGLVAVNFGLITHSHATGHVTSLAIDQQSEAGGLVGINQDTGTITHSYARGNVTAVVGSSTVVGGLVGENVGTISYAWAGGHVRGGATTRFLDDGFGNKTEIEVNSGGAGGIAGQNSGIIGFVYFNGIISGTSTTVGGLVGWGITGSLSNGFFNAANNPGLAGVGTPFGGAGNAMSRTGVQGPGLTDPVKGGDTAAAAITDSAAPPGRKTAAAGSKATDAPALGSLEANFRAIAERIEDEDASERRRARAAAKDPGYGATIRSIDVDGKRFDLQDPAAGQNAPGPRDPPAGKAP